MSLPYTTKRFTNGELVRVLKMRTVSGAPVNRGVAQLGDSPPEMEVGAMGVISDVDSGTEQHSWFVRFFSYPNDTILIDAQGLERVTDDQG